MKESSPQTDDAKESSKDSLRRFTLQRGNWYGWQMNPGYVGQGYQPYFSPVFLQEVTPRKSGRNVLKLRLFNAFYAQGVQDFGLDVRVLKRASTYLVGELLDGNKSTDRCAIISDIDFEWIQSFCPYLWSKKSLELFSHLTEKTCHSYLNEVFFNQRNLLEN